MKPAGAATASRLRSAPAVVQTGRFSVLRMGGGCPWWVVQFDGRRWFIEAKFEDRIYAEGFADRRAADQYRWSAAA
jgi:hypothetical protein